MVKKYSKQSLLSAAWEGVEKNCTDDRDSTFFISDDCGVVAQIADEDFSLCDADFFYEDVANSTDLPIGFSNRRFSNTSDGFILGVSIPTGIDLAFRFPETYSGLVKAFTDKEGRHTHWDEFAHDCANCRKLELCPFDSRWA